MEDPTRFFGPMHDKFQDALAGALPGAGLIKGFVQQLGRSQELHGVIIDNGGFQPQSWLQYNIIYIYNTHNYLSTYLSPNWVSKLLSLIVGHLMDM